MKFMKATIIAGIVALSAAPALAAVTSAAAIKNLPDGGGVTLNGTVEDFDSEHFFTLRDSTGTVKIDLSAAKSVVLTNGERVTVAGTIRNRGILGTSISARTVSEDKGVGQRIGEAIDSATGEDAAGYARTANIVSLPKSGLVKINGTVDSVDSEKKFTLKDQTGHIDIAIKPGMSASLNKGTEVTVVGYVNNGMLGKSIEATEVDVVASSMPPVAKQ